MASTHPEAPATPGADPDPPSPKERPSTLRRVLSTLVLLGVAAGLTSLAWGYRDELRSVGEAVAGKARPKAPHTLAERPSRIGRPWDGHITLSPQKQRAMGLTTVKATEQTEPIRLELLGTTDYITDTRTKIRPMFKGRVDKVHVVVNQQVKKGDPLIDLYSKDLAEAKSLYEVERIQWLYDKNLLDTREPLAKSKAISHQLFQETKNNEMKSHKEYEVARDRLFVYGLSGEEVEKLDTETGSQKARMTLRSPTEGFVIERDVVPGNLYDDNDTLLVIAPLDRLWVWGNVFESDLDLVKLGQSWEIRFPFLEQKLQGKVEYISNRVDPNSHAVRVRTSIPNPEGRLKSDMLVRGMLEIPPTPGHCVVPRTALVVDDGRYYLFVSMADRPDTFERRVVNVAQEKDDHAVIDSGLHEGEDVVSVGGLILAQIYEDLKLGQTGAPPASVGPDSN